MRLGERPSIVVIDLPATPETGIRQENMRSPSICTMQAPHWPAPQPNLVPVSLSSSRSTHRRRVLSGASTLTGLPLTVNLIAMMAPLCWGRGRARGMDGLPAWCGAMLLPAQNRRQMLRCRWPTGAQPCPRSRSGLILGYVLGPLMEEYLRRAMLLARGDATVFFTRPLSLAFMIGTVLMLAVMIYPALLNNRAAV